MNLFAGPFGAAMRYAEHMPSEKRARGPHAWQRTTVILSGASRRVRSKCGVGLGAVLLLSACGSAAVQREPPRAAPAPVRAPGELATRDPDALPSPAAAGLGALKPTDVAYRTTPRERAEPRTAQATLRAIRIANHPKPRPYPLRDGELVLPSGLIVHRVPQGVSVRAAREQQTGDQVWEIADPRGRRLALLKERSFRRAAAGSTPMLEETATLRLEARRSDWDRTPVRVIVERFRAEHHMYTLERRARGTGWILSNLELADRARADRRVD